MPYFYDGKRIQEKRQLCGSTAPKNVYEACLTYPNSSTYVDSIFIPARPIGDINCKNLLILSNFLSSQQRKTQLHVQS